MGEHLFAMVWRLIGAELAVAANDSRLPILSGAVDEVMATFSILNRLRGQRLSHNLFGRFISCNEVHEPISHYSQPIASFLKEF